MRDGFAAPAVACRRRASRRSAWRSARPSRWPTGPCREFTTSSATCLPPTRSRTAGSPIRRIRSGSTSKRFTSSSSRRTPRSIRRGRAPCWRLGQWLTGEPLAGVWLLSALAAAATYWMLLGWTSPRYARARRRAVGRAPGFQLVWGQSYWGGTLAFLGGALVFGAALRMQASHARCATPSPWRPAPSCWPSSRPFEGLVFCVLDGRVARRGTGSRQRLAAVREILLSSSSLPQAVDPRRSAASRLAAYHAAVTGDPLTLPYAVHEATYGQCPMFVGQSPAPKPDVPPRRDRRVPQRLGTGLVSPPVDARAAGCTRSSR